MVYHSAWNGHEDESLLGCGVYPIKFSKEALSGGASVGPAPKMDLVEKDPETGEEAEPTDIIDETLYYFKANMLFSTFPVKGNGDRLMLYLSLYVQTCLKRLVGVHKKNAKATMLALGIEPFSTPGDAGFVWGSFFPAVESKAEKEKWVEYIKQLRLETGFRVMRRVFQFPEEDGTGNKFWLQFAKGSALAKAFEK